MAVRIPTAASLGYNDPRAVGRLPNYPDVDPGAAGLVQLGKGVQAAGNAALDFAAEQEIKQSKLEEALASAGLAADVTRLTERLKVETDPEQITQLRAAFATSRDQHGAQIRSDYRRQLWNATNQRAVAVGEAEADLRNTAVYRDRYAAGISEKSSEVARVSAAADNPAAIRLGLETIRNNYQSAVDAGVLTNEQAFARRKRDEQQLVTGGIANAITRDQIDRAEKLLDEHGGDLDPGSADVLRRRIEAAKEKRGVKLDIDAEWGGADKGYGPRRTSGPIGGSYADRVIGIESGGRDDAKNPRSSATGAGQFIDSTWLATVKKHAPEAAVGKSDAQILGMRGDRALNQRMVDAYGSENREFLSGRGLPTDDGALYLAHFLGPAGAATVLNASPGASLASLLPAAAMSANPQLAGKTAGQLRAETSRRMGEGETKVAQADTGIATDAGGGGDAAPGLPPLPDIDAMMARVQGRADRGETTQERANAVQAGLRARYSNMQAAQATQRSALTKRLSNGAAMLADGREFEYDPAEVRHFFPKEKADELLQILADSKEDGQILSGVRTASPADLMAQREQLQLGLNEPNVPDYAARRRRAQSFDTAVAARTKALGEDPAGYAAQYSPTVAAAAAAIDGRPETFAVYANATAAEQERLGVPAENRSILGANKAAQIAGQIAALDPAKVNVGVEMSNVAQRFGEHWPQVYGDLVKHGKLPGTYQVLATMDRPDQIVAAGDLARAIGLAAEKGGMSALRKSVPDATQKEIDKRLDDELADFRESVGQQAGGARLYANVRDAAQVLAYYNGFRGQSESEAVRNAVNGIINAKYDFGTIGGGQVRVPKGTLSTVDRAARVVQSGITADQLGPVPGNPLLTPDQRKAIWLGAIRDGGWANNEDDSGLVLMGKFRDGAQSVVRRADGSRVELKFGAAPSISQAAEPAQRDDLRDFWMRGRQAPVVPMGIQP